MPQNFSSTWIMIPKTPKDSQHCQSILGQIGLVETNGQDPQQNKGLFNHYNSLGITTAFFNSQEAEKDARKRMEKDYEFIQDFSWSLPNPQLNNQVEVTPDSFSSSKQVWPSDSGIAEAHASKLKGEGVLIGVIDTGIDSDHQEFIGKSIKFRYIPPIPEDKSILVLPPRDNIRGFDPGGHGTLVCGVIAGKNIGIAPEASLYVASVMNSEKSTTSLNQILQALDWLLEEFKSKDNKGKPAILNISLGFRLKKKDEVFLLNLDSVRNAIIKLILDKDILPVVSIGNERKKFLYPGAFKEVLGIGSVGLDSKGKYQLSELSGSGQPEGEDSTKPDLVGFGVDVTTCYERKIDGT